MTSLSTLAEGGAPVRNILFLTGTRAEFGKLKPLMEAVEESPDFRCVIFVTGMHLLARYGLTVKEIERAGFTNLYPFINQMHGDPMELTLANTIGGLSRYVHEHRPDMLVVHGDRVEALAGAIVGALQDVLVAHVEGGEISGTVDELIRHAVSKLSHLHFVANAEAAERLRQLGEAPETINIIGSPDVDVMMSERLPSLETAKQRYDIDFDEYAIALYHPVTTERELNSSHAESFVRALIETGRNYVVVYPNNDEGSDRVLSAYREFEGNPRFRVFPSLRFEYFLTLLKNARFIIGNSSAGVRQAPGYGVRTVNVGTRQQNRYKGESVIDVGYETDDIVSCVRRLDDMDRPSPALAFGDGQSAQRFMQCLTAAALWETPRQKQFCDALPGLPLAPFGVPVERER